MFLNIRPSPYDARERYMIIGEDGITSIRGMGLDIGKALAATFYIVFGIIWVTMTIAIPSGIGPLFTIAGIVVILFGLRSIMRRPGYSRREDVPEDPARNLPESPVEPERHDGSSFGYCPYCGSPLEKGFNYCGVCGRKLRWSLP